jgi:hypothetical protein
MPTITITINVPNGTTVNVDTEPDESLTPDAGSVTSKQLPGAVKRYWESYLSDNGRSLYGAAAAIEREQGRGFTLVDIADRMGRPYPSAQSIHRTTGRSARKWKEDSGTEPPIRLEVQDYSWDDSASGWRTSYQLPDGVADEIAGF